MLAAAMDSRAAAPHLGPVGACGPRVCVRVGVCAGSGALDPRLMPRSPISLAWRFRKPLAFLLTPSLSHIRTASTRGATASNPSPTSTRHARIIGQAEGVAMHPSRQERQPKRLRFKSVRGGRLPPDMAESGRAWAEFERVWFSLMYCRGDR